MALARTVTGPKLDSDSLSDTARRARDSESDTVTAAPARARAVTVTGDCQWSVTPGPRTVVRVTALSRLPTGCQPECQCGTGSQPQAESRDRDGGMP